MKFDSWKNHFKRNRSHFDHIDWTQLETLTPQERNDISASIQQFQKGESSEGHNLIKSAERYVLHKEDKSYLETIKLFIKEEQSHAAALGHFMYNENIPKIKHHWIDDIFRILRRGSNLEKALLTLVSAEIIATEYYKALSDATQSATLKAICKQILIDEEHHVNFQAYTMRTIYTPRSVWKNVISKGVNLALLGAAITTVYISHKRVFKKSNKSFFQFAFGSLKEFVRFQSRILKYNSITKQPLLTQTINTYETTI